jgi:hypothetical protein
MGLSLEAVATAAAAAADDDDKYKTGKSEGMAQFFNCWCSAN